MDRFSHILGVEAIVVELVLTSECIRSMLRHGHIPHSGVNTRTLPLSRPGQAGVNTGPHVLPMF